MDIYDISLTIDESIPTWPDDKKPIIKKNLSLEEGEIANVTHIEMSAHTGTHVDAPCHFIKEGKSVESLPLDVLIGDALVIDCLQEDILTESFFQNAKIPDGTKRLLLKTKNSLQWEKKNPGFIKDYVAINATGAKYLVEKKIELIGIDYLSIAPFKELMETHEILLGSNIIVIEGLNLKDIKPGNYDLCCLPLKIANADGAPARVVLTK